MPTLSELIASSGGISKAQASELSKSLSDAMLATLTSGEDVNIPGFGKFVVKDTPSRKGRNPATGEEIDIPAGRKIAFNASSVAKAALKG